MSLIKKNKMNQEGPTECCKDVNLDKKWNSLNENLIFLVEMNKNLQHFSSNEKKGFDFSSSPRESCTSNFCNPNYYPIFQIKTFLGKQKDFSCRQIGDTICPKLENSWKNDITNSFCKAIKIKSGDEKHGRHVND